MMSTLSPRQLFLAVLAPTLLMTAACSDGQSKSDQDGAAPADSAVDVRTAVDVVGGSPADGPANRDVASDARDVARTYGVDAHAVDSAEDTSQRDVWGADRGADLRSTIDATSADAPATEDAPTRHDSHALDGAGYDLGPDAVEAAAGLDAGAIDGPAAPAPELKGTWTSPCSANCANCQQWAVTKYTFQENRLHASYDIYDGDSACTDASRLLWRDVLDADLTWDAPTRRTLDLWPVDVTVSTLTATALSSSAAVQANQARVHGFSDWQAGVAKNVAGTPSANGTGTEPAIGATRFGLLARDQDRLYLGNLTGPFPLDTQRPTDVRADVYLTRSAD